MQLVIVLIRLEVVDGLLPVRREDVLELAVQTLVHVRPGSGIELCGCETGACKLKIEIKLLVEAQGAR